MTTLFLFRAVKCLGIGVLLWSLCGCRTVDINTAVEGMRPSVPEGVTFVNAHTPAPGEVGIAYQRFRLDNGLTIILHQDDSDPLAHIDVTYHVGSSREEFGKSGFAHFFEHMMFQGSKHVADEEHFKVITASGGSLNGSTNSDRTNYYQTVPANQLEKVLWLEADRMGFLLEAVTQQKFEIQRETVKNERAQRFDNRPYGLLRERVAEALYPQQHPYAWPVIGYVEDLDRVTVKDLKHFFQRWYGPNNAIITVGGDIDVAQTLRWIKRYFANIRPAQATAKLPKELINLPETRYITLVDKIHLPLLQMTFPTVFARHQDEAALDVLADILGGGKHSLLHRHLVQSGMAVQVGVKHPCRELACQFDLVAVANPNAVAGLQDVERAIAAALREFEQQGVTLADIQRTVATIESASIFGLQSVAGKVSSLAFNQYSSGEPDLVQFDLERYRAITPADVMRVYQQYLEGRHAVIMSVVPTGKEALAARAATFTTPQRVLELDTVVDFTPRVQLADAFDRSVAPSAGPAVSITVPDFWQASLQNGVAVMGYDTKETPTVLLTLNLEGGPLLDPVAKAGLAHVTANMMQESTQQRSAAALAERLASMGSSIRFSANGRNTTIAVTTLTVHLDATLALLREMLLQPAFKQADFERLMTRTQESVRHSLNSAGYLENRAIRQLLYGAENRLGLPSNGTLSSLQNITLADVRAFYRQYYSPAKARLVVVGDIAQHALLAKLDFLANWQGSDYPIPPHPAFPAANTQLIYLVDRPGASQAEVSVFKSALPFDATGEQFRTSLMNFPLGGHFNSRINAVLREEKGYTYGVGSRFVAGKTLGQFVVDGSIKHQHTADALRDLLEQMERYREHGMTAQELDTLRNAYTLGDALNYETPANKAGFLLQLQMFDLEPSYVSLQNDTIKRISMAELNALAEKHLAVSSMQIVIVGQVSQLQGQLQGLAEEIGRELRVITIAE